MLRLAADMLLLPATIDPGWSTNGAGARPELAAYRAAGVAPALEPIQAETARERGLAETRATIRRWYLYIVSLAGVAVLLFSAGRVVYEAVLVALGRAPDPALLAISVTP